MEKINLEPNSELKNNPVLKKAVEEVSIPENAPIEASSEPQVIADAEKLLNVRGELSRMESPEISEVAENSLTGLDQSSHVAVKKDSKLVNWLKKSLGIGSAVAMGYLGSMDDASAKDINSPQSIQPKNKVESKVEVKEKKVFENDLFSIVDTGKTQKGWSGSKNEDLGVYDVVDKETGQKRQFLKKNLDVSNPQEIENAKEFLFPIHPEWFPDIKKAVETEREFQQSGLTDPEDSYKGTIEIK